MESEVLKCSSTYHLRLNWHAIYLIYINSWLSFQEKEVEEKSNTCASAFKIIETLRYKTNSTRKILTISIHKLSYQCKHLNRRVGNMQSLMKRARGKKILGQTSSEYRNNLES